MDNPSPKVCLKCGKPLTGRADKKFCDAYCRNAFNNQQKSSDEHYMQSVNSKIRKNRRILKNLSPEGKATVRKEVLDQLGYNYLYFSSIFRSSKGHVYYLVYDYGFSPIHESGVEKALIIQKQDYMEKPSFDIWRKKGGRVK